MLESTPGAVLTGNLVPTVRGLPVIGELVRAELTRIARSLLRQGRSPEHYAWYRGVPERKLVWSLSITISAHGPAVVTGTVLDRILRYLELHSRCLSRSETVSCTRA